MKYQGLPANQSDGIKGEYNDGMKKALVPVN
jgi:hypothetical protein